MATVKDSLPTAVQRIRPADYELASIQDNLAQVIDKLLSYLRGGAANLVAWGPVSTSIMATSGTWYSIGPNSASPYRLSFPFTLYLLGMHVQALDYSTVPIRVRVQDLTADTTLWRLDGTLDAGDRSRNSLTSGQYALTADHEYGVQVMQESGSDAVVAAAAYLYMERPPT